MAGRTERIMRTMAARDYPTLVATVRQPPRWHPARLGSIDMAVNFVEFFTHTEDVRRAQPNWVARPTTPEFDAALWRRVPSLTKARFATFPAMIPGPRLDRSATTVLVRAPGHGEARVGTGQSTVTVTGPPGELVLFLFGRVAAAQVEIEGPAELVERLRNG